MRSMQISRADGTAYERQPCALGVDLAWGYRATTGVCALGLVGGRWQMEAHGSGRFDDDQVVAWIAGHADDGCVVAIDAPLFIPTQTGTRPCDQEVARRYWRCKIGVHACNRTRFPKPRGEAVRRELERSLGFREARRDRGASRVYFETYPHPAIVNLLDLEERIPYKKGRVARRRAQLRKLAGLLLEALPRLDPPVVRTSGLEAVLCRDWFALRGRALKAAEDEIDALVCAYAAAHWIAHGDCERNEVVGTTGQGMMVFPARRR